MLELVSVDLGNFRSFASAQFAPLGNGLGMTAINGGNGMGKSSIVHGILWALFGITPEGVPVRALRRQGSEGDVVVTVVFRHDGQTVEVVRALRGRADKTVAGIKVDGVELTIDHSRLATEWIVNRLGLDGEAFLTAFVVRQKELDSLVKARPAERRKTIERLAGIERMSAAVVLARKEAATAKIIFSSLPETEDPATVQSSVDAFVAAFELAGLAKVAAEEASVDAQRVLNVKEAAVRAARDKVQAVQVAQNSVDLSTQKFDVVNSTVERLDDLTVGAEDLSYAVSNLELARKARGEAEQALTAVTAIIALANTERSRLEEAERVARRAEKVLEDADFKLSEVIAEVEKSKDPVEFVAPQAAANERLSLATAERGAAEGEVARLKKAIVSLRETADKHMAECPTCSQHLDDPVALVEVLTLSVEDAERRIGAARVAEQKASVELRQLASDLAFAVSVRQKLEGVVEAQAAAVVAVAEANEKVAKFEDSAEQAAEDAHEAQTNAARATEQIEGLRVAEASAQTALRKAENAAAAAVELVGAQELLVVAESNLALARKNLAEIKLEAVGLDVTALEAEARVASLEASTATEAASAARTVHVLALRDLEGARVDLARAVDGAEKRKAALAELERTSVVSSALEEFRRDRLARLAPELSEVASDFVSRMTNGRFTAIELDEEFTPVLTESTGEQRPVSWLSGGEESAVALALRVAIGEVLAGQRGGLLVLDEVLTAQDQDRRQATMAAIRALPRQVVTINHVSEATDMVDLVAEVVDDGEGASTIQAYTPDSVGSGNLSDEILDA